MARMTWARDIEIPKKNLRRFTIWSQRSLDHICLQIEALAQKTSLKSSRNALYLSQNFHNQLLQMLPDSKPIITQEAQNQCRRPTLCKNFDSWRGFWTQSNSEISFSYISPRICNATRSTRKLFLQGAFFGPERKWVNWTGDDVLRMEYGNRWIRKIIGTASAQATRPSALYGNPDQVRQAATIMMDSLGQRHNRLIGHGVYPTLMPSMGKYSTRL